MAASSALVFTKGLNLGVDFVGGQMIRVTFVAQRRRRRSAELREEIGALGYGEPIIQQFGKPNEVSIRMKLPEGADADPGAGRRDGAADHRDDPGRASRRADRRGRFGFGQGLGASCSATGMHRAARRDGRRSRSTSGSASNGSSASARCSRWSTT